MDKEMDIEVESTVIELGAVSEETKGVFIGAESGVEPNKNSLG